MHAVKGEPGADTRGGADPAYAPPKIVKVRGKNPIIKGLHAYFHFKQLKCTIHIGYYCKL